MNMEKAKERLEVAITVVDDPNKPSRINLGELKQILRFILDEIEALKK